jgi:hypothetical protein
LAGEVFLTSEEHFSGPVAIPLPPLRISSLQPWFYRTPEEYFFGPVDISE